ncbi:MAG: transposase [Erysipelotrichaceae bacterium]|nr:transposase [Erysipelotrichaceae bacterium]
MINIIPSRPKVEKKQKLIIEIQKRWNELDEKKTYIIVEEFNISKVSAKKYVNMSEEDIRSLDKPKKHQKTKGTATDDYINIIYKMLSDGVAPEIIFSYIIHKGYKGTWRALDNRIYYMLKNNFNRSLPMNYYLDYKYPSTITVIKRNDVIKYLTTKDDKIEVNKTVEKYIGIIKDKYPVIIELEEIYNEFYDILMNNDDPSLLDDFIDKYEDSKLEGFINGIKKDIAPVKNAISYPQSSGFVEGNNNKFKLIKRILYGRSGTVNLFRKCYLPFLVTHQDVDLMKTVKKGSIINCTA